MDFYSKIGELGEPEAAHFVNDIYNLALDFFLYSQ